MPGKWKSIMLSTPAQCYICALNGKYNQPNHPKEETEPLEKFLIFGNENRRACEADGVYVMLCPEHTKKIKFSSEYSTYLKRVAEGEWLREYNKTQDDFAERFGGNLL